jgi:hypothetical protein
VILVGAVLALLVAVGFGIGATFHFIELRYGENVAFAAVGGIFALIGLLGVLIGMVLLKRQLPPVPRPRRQVQEFKRALAVPAAVQVMRDVGQQNVIMSDPVMKILLGAAAALVIGWMASSTFSSSGRVSKE